MMKPRYASKEPSRTGLAVDSFFRPASGTGFSAGGLAAVLSGAFVGRLKRRFFGPSQTSAESRYSL